VLGVLVLAAVPVHSAVRADAGVLRADDYLDPACRTPLAVFPEPVCPKVVAGESPATIAFALLVVPLGLRRATTGWLMAIALASAGFAALHLVAPFGLTFESTSGRVPSPWQADEGCGLVNCGLDHTLFHLAQVPFFVAIALGARRLARL
jgi:hypothetical protein